MKKIGFIKGTAVALCVAMIFTGCSSLKNTWNGMSQSGQGATAGGAIGAAVGTGVGALIGGGKGTWIGALVGSALGAGTGALVGNHMDKQKQALEAQLAQMQAQTDQNSADIAKNSKDIQDIKIQMVKDRNNLDAIKLVLGDAILFPTGKSTLSQSAEAALTRVAYNLKQFPDLLITHATASAFPDGHFQISFDFSFLFFQHRLLVRTGNEAAFPMNCNNESFFFQSIIGFLDRQCTDFQFLCKCTYRRKCCIFLQFPMHDSFFNLSHDLFIDGLHG